MKSDWVEKIANAVLYEGYMLYPYRPSAVKNQQRWNFGTLYPRQFHEVRHGTERSCMHVECMVQSQGDPQIEICARFLQLDSHSLELCCDEVIERSVTLNARQAEPARFFFASNSGGVNGTVHVSMTALGQNLTKLTVDLVNDSSVDPDSTRKQVLPKSLLSAHMILCAESGDFVSFLDPPDSLREEVAGCRNVGCLPVLVGDPGEHNMLLCSPIILYDYPQVAPESGGDFFDGTEMDEMLTLRVMTLADEEKNEMRRADDRTRSLLERTEQTAREQLMRTHGTIRTLRPLNEE